MEMFVVFGGLVLVLLFMFLRGSKVDPDDNPIWCSEPTRAHKRKCKLERMYTKELNLCTTFKINGQDEYVKWYHRYGKHYINGVEITLSNVGTHFYKVSLYMYVQHIGQGRESSKVSTEEFLELVGISPSTYQYLIDEELI